MKKLLILATTCYLACVSSIDGAEPMRLQLRDKPATADGSGFTIRERDVEWDPSSTALIVCDVWDQHHSINAVRRLAEFAPRLNELVVEARRRGVTIIHAPSDCMAAYAEHPARLRAQNAPQAASLPPNVTEWCSIVPAEKQATYPIDQSDGGSDDDPIEGREWAAKLKAMGRNPGTPWQRQSDTIAIDGEKDFISDRGDEVWNVLESLGVKNVILTGVHVNMCVLGRPFGLRRMVLGGKNVVLVRDLTDAMYNPAMWPYVDHFTGNDLVLHHIERYVCPTVTSEQLLGGEPFRFAGSSIQLPKTQRQTQPRDELHRHWTTLSLPSDPKQFPALHAYEGPAWFRCVVVVPSSWRGDELELVVAHHYAEMGVWLNGTPLTRLGFAGSLTAVSIYPIPANALRTGDANLLVIRHASDGRDFFRLHSAAIFRDAANIKLEGRWQFRIGDDPSWSNMPLPAKFGTSTDIVFELPATLPQK